MMSRAFFAGEWGAEVGKFMSGIRLYMHAHPFRRFPADKGKNLGKEKFR